jgi:hypothetical protein
VVEALARAERFDEARGLAQQIHSEGRRAAALAGVVEVLAGAKRFDEARALAQQISHEDWQARALIVIAQRWAEIAHWDAVIRVISEVVTITIRQYDAISDFLSTLPHPPTVLILVQRLWSQATRRNDFYALLPAAAPLFVADPTLLSQILAGEKWVQEQLEW